MTDYGAIYAKASRENAPGIGRDNLDAGIAAVVAAAKGEALAPILALHRPEKRYHPSGIGDRSWENENEAREYADAEDEVMESFEVCRECGRIEAELWQESGDEWSYRESLWPCPTFNAPLAAAHTTDLREQSKHYTGKAMPDGVGE
jgi:hypothetical protein